MSAEERQREIVVAARRSGSVDVAELATQLGVAKETVRRDLRVLESHGLLRRTHGGAYPVESAGFETTLAFRTTLHVPEKRRIAAAAVEQLGDAETVFIDEGFTPQLIAEALPSDRPLTVVTASLAAAGALASAEATTVLLLGGRVRGGTLATVDHWTTKMLAGFVLDLAFIGANGISREHGLTTPDPAVSEVKAQAVRALPAANFHRHAYQVRCGELLQVRRGRGLRNDHHLDWGARLRGPSLLTPRASSDQSLTPGGCPSPGVRPASYSSSSIRIRHRPTRSPHLRPLRPHMTGRPSCAVRAAAGRVLSSVSRVPMCCWSPVPEQAASPPAATPSTYSW